MLKENLQEDSHEGIAFLESLSKEERQSLQDDSSLHSYGKNTPLFHQGDPASHLIVILSGWVKLSVLNADGEESGVLMQTRGDVLGAESIFDGQSYLSAADAATKTRVLKIPAEILKQRAKASPQIAGAVMAALARRIKLLQIEEACASLKDAPARIACLLIRLSLASGKKDGTLPLPCTKAALAAWLGMDQATFSRGLAQLESRGITSQGSIIHIQDESVLSKTCCHHCPVSRDLCLTGYAPTGGRGSR